MPSHLPSRRDPGRVFPQAKGLNGLILVKNRNLVRGHATNVQSVAWHGVDTFEESSSRPDSWVSYEPSVALRSLPIR
ncbi:hypothetical protein N656DRAFT_208132 [Canariomyces notabilis]|uniref:Uncharacterized protein n=1 Tax=Canariomyces notabilis TaxID=2074819 RepID=A0AAN6QLJ1_9PEZI|nr:hypothetical protein N656DRAFT_208132 [Canariomyces arenarius]